jgi:hypothetical protein
MHPADIIASLNSRFKRPNAISVECKIDNFPNNRDLQVRYNIYVAACDEMPTACHCTCYNLEDAFAAANIHINGNYINLAPVLPADSPNPFTSFTSCLSSEQDEEIEIEPLDDQS